MYSLCLLLLVQHLDVSSNMLHHCEQANILHGQWGGHFSALSPTEGGTQGAGSLLSAQLSKWTQAACLQQAHHFCLTLILSGLSQCSYIGQQKGTVQTEGRTHQH